jgi:hypothetical protein
MLFAQCEKFHLVTFEIFSDQGWRGKDGANKWKLNYHIEQEEA